ncbi:MAG: hypothetical protein IIY06_05845 [Proteobacteria bacterium]|nr:hypothetical protein [Pseudomonadota bacterium]
MRYLYFMLHVLFIMTLACAAYAQDESSHNAPIAFELDEEKLSIEADIPSVDLILSFREVQERNKERAQSFLEDVVESARHEPF